VTKKVVGVSLFRAPLQEDDDDDDENKKQTRAPDTVSSVLSQCVRQVRPSWNIGENGGNYVFCLWCTTYVSLFDHGWIGWKICFQVESQLLSLKGTVEYSPPGGYFSVKMTFNELGLPKVDHNKGGREGDCGCCSQNLEMLGVHGCRRQPTSSSVRKYRRCVYAYDLPVQWTSSNITFTKSL
jgi:hypothetical protein